MLRLTKTEGSECKSVVDLFGINFVRTQELRLDGICSMHARPWIYST